MDLFLRPAAESDLPSIYRTWMASEGEAFEGDGPVPVALSHMLTTGRVVVAERSGAVTGFATSIVRDGVTFLGQLFVDPAEQSAGVGQSLLRAAMPDDGTVRATVSSPDPRAVSVYVRHGMTPVWPLFDLSVHVSALRHLPVSMASIVPAQPGDPELLTSDALAGGRRRPEDHQHWLEQRGGVPFWFERKGRRIGYGYLQVARMGADAALRGDSVRIGPLGVVDDAHIYDCLLAAVGFARDYGGELSVLVPGPNPALGAVLEAGFRIGDIETFMTSAQPPFVDGRCYVPSGGGLF